MQPAKRQKTACDDVVEAPPPRLENTAARLAGQVLSGQTPVEQAVLDPVTSLVSYCGQDLSMAAFLEERKKKANLEVKWRYDGKQPLMMCICAAKCAMRNVSKEERTREGKPLLECAYCTANHNEKDGGESNMYVCTACSRVSCLDHVYAVNWRRMMSGEVFAMALDLDDVHRRIRMYIKSSLGDIEASLLLYRENREKIQKFAAGYSVWDAYTHTTSALFELVTSSIRFQQMGDETKKVEMETLKNLFDKCSRVSVDNAEDLETLREYRNLLEFLGNDAGVIVRTIVKVKPDTEIKLAIIDLKRIVNPGKKLHYLRCFRDTAAYHVYPPYTFPKDEPMEAERILKIMKRLHWLPTFELKIAKAEKLKKDLALMAIGIGQILLKLQVLISRYVETSETNMRSPLLQKVLDLIEASGDSEKSRADALELRTAHQTFQSHAVRTLLKKREHAQALRCIENMKTECKRIRSTTNNEFVRYLGTHYFGVGEEIPAKFLLSSSSGSMAVSSSESMAVSSSESAMAAVGSSSAMAAAGSSSAIAAAGSSSAIAMSSPESAMAAVGSSSAKAAAGSSSAMAAAGSSSAIAMSSPESAKAAAGSSSAIAAAGSSSAKAVAGSSFAIAVSSPESAKAVAGSSIAVAGSSFVIAVAGSSSAAGALTSPSKSAVAAGALHSPSSKSAVVVAGAPSFAKSAVVAGAPSFAKSVAGALHSPSSSKSAASATMGTLKSGESTSMESSFQLSGGSKVGSSAGVKVEAGVERKRAPRRKRVSVDQQPMSESDAASVLIDFSSQLDANAAVKPEMI